MKKLLILGAFFVFITIGNAQTWEYYNTYAYTNDIAIDAQGNKWVSTAWEGFSKFSNNQFYNIPNFRQTVDKIVIDSTNNKWIIRRDGNLYKYDNDSLISYGNFQMPSGNTGIYEVVIDKLNTAWVASPFGLGKSITNDFIKYKIADGLPSNDIRSIAVDAFNNKWLATQHGLSKFDGINFTNYTTANSGLLSDSINTIFIDQQGIKWIGTPNGLSKFDGITFTNYTAANGLAHTRILGIIEDTQGIKWIRSRSGISKFDGTTFTNYTTLNGWALSGVYVANIALDNANNLWIGSYFGALKFDGVTFTAYTTTNGLPDNSVRVFIDKQNDVWFTTQGAGLCVLRNSTTAIETVTTAQPQLALYPNPTTNTLYFPELQGKTFVEIVDTQGKLLLSQSLSQNNIDISSLCAGIYFVKTKNEQGYFVNKIVKE